jgi:hypothetical protein
LEATNSRNEGQRRSVRTARGRNGNAHTINRPQGPKGEIKMAKMNVGNAPNINQEENKKSVCNVVELVDKRRADAGVGDDRKESLTQEALAAHSGSTPSHLTDEEVDELIIGVLRDASAGLTEVEIGAVLALRHHIETATVLEQMLLEGEIEARKKDKNGPLMDANNYSFRRRIPKSEDVSIDEVPPAE